MTGQEVAGLAPGPEPMPRVLDATEAARSLATVMRLSAGFVLALALFAVLLLGTPPTLTTVFYVQDLVGLLVLSTILFTAGVLPAPAALGRWCALAAWPRWTGLVLAVVVIGLTILGNRTIYHAFALSYDEVMAEFDAQIFRAGNLIQALPPEWRPYRQALAPHFLLPIPGDQAWASAYLPVNAMMRALFCAIGTPALTGPVLLGVALLAIVGVSRRLWPDRPDAALVAALLLASSPQTLITAMTPYAMTGHLTLNLVWLWLFLRGGRIGHGGAVLVGFLACGLHQTIFHPLFVAPFLLGLLMRRRWSLAAFYAIAYAAIGLFWMVSWPELQGAPGIAPAHPPDAPAGLAVQAARILALLSAFAWSGLDLMAKNLIRFVTWQSPVLVPLLILAWPALRRVDGQARSLAAGLGLTILTMFVLLPYQGHGWGYRYLHGLIGSACLLGAYGWVTLTRAYPSVDLASARARLGLAFAAGLLILPHRATQVEHFVAPYAAAAAAIAAFDTDIVLVDDRDLVFGSDLVRNTPTLVNRPILVLRRAIASEADLRALCTRGSLGVFGAAEAARIGLAIVSSGAGAASTPTPNPCSPVPANAPG